MTGFWSRVRIVSAPSTPPVFERAIHPLEQHHEHPRRGDRDWPGPDAQRHRSRRQHCWRDRHGGHGCAGGRHGRHRGGVDPPGPERPAQQQRRRNLLSVQAARGPRHSARRHAGAGCTFSDNASPTQWPVGIMSLLCVETSGVLVADPAGGIVPVKRTAANTDTLTANAGQFVSKDMQPEGATLSGPGIVISSTASSLGPLMCPPATQAIPSIAGLSSTAMARRTGRLCHGRRLGGRAVHRAARFDLTRDCR